MIVFPLVSPDSIEAVPSRSKRSTPRKADCQGRGTAEAQRTLDNQPRRAKMRSGRDERRRQGGHDPASIDGLQSDRYCVVRSNVI